MTASHSDHSDAVRVHTEYTAPQVRVVFMGTSAFAATILASLIDRKYNIVAVYTQTDKPVGRKKELQPSPVKTLALERLDTVPLEQPARWDDDAFHTLRDHKPDIVVVAAYGKILPGRVLSLPGFGCVNVHASLLPRWRGASPIHNALLAGDTETGITLMQMDEGVDTGALLSHSTLPIDPTDTTATLSEKLAALGAELLLDTLPRWIKRDITPAPQESGHATLCQLIEREDGRVFWNEDAETLDRKFRAFTPWPGIFAFWRQTDGSLLRLKLIDISFQKTDTDTPRKLGEIFEIGEHVGVQTGHGILFLKTVQLEGKLPAAIRDFVSGYPNFIGGILE